MLALLLAMFQTAAGPVGPVQPPRQTPQPVLVQPAAEDVTDAQTGAGMFAPVIWLGDAPQPGEVVKLRVRGEVLDVLLAARTEWHLVADGETVPAQLYWPSSPGHGEDTPLKFEATESGGEVVATIDLGQTPPVFNQLVLKFADQELLGSVQLFAGSSSEQYSALGGPQLVYQRITDSCIVRVNTLDCELGANRYVKLVISGQPGTQLVSIEGRKVPPPAYDYYEIPVSFGAPLSDSATRKRLLPIELESSGLQLCKLKLDTETDYGTLELSIVRLSPAGSIARTITQTAWGKQLELAGISRDISAIAFFDDAGGEEPWALALPAGEHRPVEFTGVAAWAAEVYITYSVPEAGELMLCMQAPPEAAPYTAPIPPSQLALIPCSGEFTRLEVPQPPQAASREVFALPESLSFDFTHWKYALLCGSLGLACLMIGLAALRRRASSA